MSETRVFVYGTLKAGQPNHSCLDGAIAEGEAEIGKGKFIMAHLGQFPALFVSREGPTISGETYLVGDETLRRLDYLEGYPDFYNRDTILVHRKDGSSVEALVYYIEGEPSINDKLISSGVW